jgi:hypothetical protein
MGKNIIIEELDRIKTLMGIIKEGEELDGGPLKIRYSSSEKKVYGNTSTVIVKGISNDDKILMQNNRDKDIILVKNSDGKEVKIGKNPFVFKDITWDPYIKNNDGKYNVLIGNDRTLSHLLKYDKDGNTYQKTLRQLLQKIYSTKTDENGEPMYGESVKDENCKTNRGVIHYRGVKYGQDFSLRSDWSILNYFDTNSEVISKLLEIYANKTKTSLEGKEENFEDFKVRFLNWLIANGEEILGPESIYLDDLEELNWSTLKRGIINEQNAINVLRQIHNIEEGGLTEYCPGSIQDTRYGRDLKVNSEDLYYQIKPLNGYVKSSTIEGFKYAVPTSSMKKYNPNYVDRLMFINDNGSKYVIFENNDYEVVSKGGLVLFKNEPLFNV